jgi:hypothetical protein
VRRSRIPDKGRTHTGRRAFLAVGFRYAAGARGGVFANHASPARAPYTLQRKNVRFPPLLCFQDVNAHSPRGCRTITRSRGFFLLAACFLQVYARKRVNGPFFALLSASSLIPCTLTFVNRKLLCSSRLGVTCHTYSPCEARLKTLTPTTALRGDENPSLTVPESPRCQVRIRRQDRRLLTPRIRAGIGCRVHPQIANNWRFFDYRNRKRRDKEPSAYDFGNFARKRRSAYRGDHRPRHPDPPQVKIWTAEGSAAKERTCPALTLTRSRIAALSLPRNANSRHSAPRSGSGATALARRSRET